MKHIPEEVLFSHPKYFLYESYLSEMANPECHGCAMLTELTSRYAIEALSSLAITNFRKTKIKGVDQDRENMVLRKAQSDLLNQIADCAGPKVIDNDMELARERILSFPRLTDEFREAALANIIPVAEVCGRDMTIL